MGLTAEPVIRVRKVSRCRDASNRFVSSTKERSSVEKSSHSSLRAADSPRSSNIEGCNW